MLAGPHEMPRRRRAAKGAADVRAGIKGVGMVKLAVQRTMGAVHHRSGWPYAMRALDPLDAEDGIPFEDYVEGAFEAGRGKYYDRPWIGVFHHPPYMPAWYRPDQHLPAILRRRNWRRSCRHLKLAIALSEYLGNWLERHLHVPVLCLKHPTETPERKFSEQRYLSNPHKCIFQLGWYLRNTEAIYQLPQPRGFRKVRVAVPGHWVEKQMAVVGKHGPAKRRRRQGQVVETGRLSDAGYDALLSQNVVFLELYDVSANNVVIECIVRNTPIVVNRHPALEEYLGTEYPLFYDRFGDACGLFTDERILAGHRYLNGLDKTPFDGGFFRDRIAQAVRSVFGDWPRSPVA